MYKNTSYAVMAQRIETKDSLDDFPTPPWATRALVEHALGDKRALASMSCLEPACGVGHMAKVLREYFAEVRCSDVHPYGYGDVGDFVRAPSVTNPVDWLITNPPFPPSRGVHTQGATGGSPRRRDAHPHGLHRKRRAV